MPPSPLHASILAYPADLSHAEVYRRLTAVGVEVSRATVAAVRRTAYGAREAGAPPGEDRLLLATLRTVAERHGVAPGEVVVAGDRALTRRRR